MEISFTLQMRLRFGESQFRLKNLKRSYASRILRLQEQDDFHEWTILYL